MLSRKAGGDFEKPNWKSHEPPAEMPRNIVAGRKAGWDFENPELEQPGALPRSVSVEAQNSAAQDHERRMPALDAYWADWGRGMFGGTAGAEAGRTMRQLDGGHLAINSLVNAAAPPTGERISEDRKSTRLN